MATAEQLPGLKLAASGLTARQTRESLVMGGVPAPRGLRSVPPGMVSRACVLLRYALPLGCRVIGVADPSVEAFVDSWPDVEAECEAGLAAQAAKRQQADARRQEAIDIDQALGDAYRQENGRDVTAATLAQLKDLSSNLTLQGVRDAISGTSHPNLRARLAQANLDSWTATPAFEEELTIDSADRS